MYLGTFFRVPVYLHWSGMLQIALVTIFVGHQTSLIHPDWTIQAAMCGVLIALGLMVTVIIHELGHAVAAQYAGGSCSAIHYHFLGGVALLADIHDLRSPDKYGLMALAGPFTNMAMVLLIAIAIIFRMMLTPELTFVEQLENFGLFWTFMCWMVIANLNMIAFNLLPLLPLDGGRATYAALWQVSGSRKASMVVAAGMTTLGMPMLFTIAFYAYMEGWVLQFTVWEIGALGFLLTAGAWSETLHIWRS